MSDQGPLQGSYWICTAYLLFCVLGQVDPSRVAYRPRESPYPMITVDQAVSMVMEHAQPLPEETINFTGK